MEVKTWGELNRFRSPSVFLNVLQREMNLLKQGIQQHVLYGSWQNFSSVQTYASRDVPPGQVLVWDGKTWMHTKTFDELTKSNGAKATLIAVDELAQSA